MKGKSPVLVTLLVLAAPLSRNPCPAATPLLKGDQLNAFLINEDRLYYRRIRVRDYMGSITHSFTRLERDKLLRPCSFVKLRLRDSKLNCFVPRYSLKTFNRLKEISKGSQVTVTGYLERIGKGTERYTNPRFVLRVEEIDRGWNLDSHEEIFAGEGLKREYAELTPEDYLNAPEKLSGKSLKIRDRFARVSDYYTNFEKELNLRRDRTIKFYSENCRWPFYILRTPESLKVFEPMKAGEKVTIYGDLCEREVGEESLHLFAVRRIESGWQPVTSPPVGR